MSDLDDREIFDIDRGLDALNSRLEALDRDLLELRAHMVEYERFIDKQGDTIEQMVKTIATMGQMVLEQSGGDPASRKEKPKTVN